MNCVLKQKFFCHLNVDATLSGVYWSGEKVLCEIFIVVYICTLIIAILLSVTYTKALEC